MTLTLVRTSQRQAQAAMSRSPGPWDGQSPDSKPRVPATRERAPRVVVIDPNAYVGELIARTLRSTGYIVTIVRGSHTQGSLSYLGGGRADVVLLDPLLPSWEQGLALCREICERSGVPLVLVTSRYLDDEIDAALAAGAADVICKPFSPRELVARVTAVVSRHALPLS